MKTTSTSRFSFHWSPFRAVVCCYLGLTLFYYLLGYLGALHERIAGPDSTHYYMYIRSLFFDGDLNFSNEVVHYFGKARLQAFITPATGLPGNQWSVGPSIFWLPFFLLAHWTTLLANMFGAHLAVDGYSILYSGFIWMGNSIYCLLGFYFVAQALSRFARPPAVSVACLTLLFASQLSYYIWPLTAMAHNTAFFATSVYLYSLLKKGVRAQTVFWAGVQFLCRWQTAIYLLPLFALALRDAAAIARKEPKALPRLCLRYMLLALLLLLVMAPQLVVWHHLYGSYVLVPHGHGFINLMQLKLWPVLFSLQKGVFAWHPALLGGIAGLFLLYRKERFWSVLFLGAVALQLLFISTLHYWSAGWSFGQRFMIESLPFLAIGVAVLYDQLSSKRLRRIMLACLLLLALWNQLFLFQYQRGLIPRSEGITARQFFADKFLIARRARAKYLLRQALRQQRVGDFPAFKKYALAARVLNPHEERTAMAAGLACIVAADRAEAIRIFQLLASLHPDDGLYARTLTQLKKSIEEPSGSLLQELRQRLIFLING